ncbi:MAG: hypothetical protein CL573_01515 [Alphaproteobacteria bacterium]|nr:hypothetical protein [Alphaproteobacteria bacterium]
MNLIVTPTAQHRGMLSAFGQSYNCALGRAGVSADKREGDGATPVGRFAMRAIRYRADRLVCPQTVLPANAICPEDGWCDDPSDPSYNRPVTHPHRGSAERMWRDDLLYDLLVILGHNDTPPVPGRGSAIFLHCATPELGPTEGCVALPSNILRALIPQLGHDTTIEIRAF